MRATAVNQIPVRRVAARPRDARHHGAAEAAGSATAVDTAPGSCAAVGAGRPRGRTGPSFVRYAVSSWRRAFICSWWNRRLSRFSARFEAPQSSFMNPQRRRRTCPQFLIGAPVGPSRAAPTHRYGARMSGSLIDGEDVEVLVVPLPRVGLTPPTRSYAALQPVAPRPSIRPAPRLSRERTGLAAAGAQSPHMACTARTCENQLHATECG
jgi:hypothetical protein